MCGLVGIVGTSAVNQRIYDALTVLQHRGQDAAGIMTMDEHALFVRKDAGLVRDVFGEEHMRQLVGNAGIGHVRYPTAGCDGADEAQPFYVNAPFGIGLGHNGNLTNAEELARTMSRRTAGTSTRARIPRCCSTCSRASCNAPRPCGRRRPTCSARSRACSAAAAAGMRW